MFDQFGAVNISHEDRRHEWLIDFLHEINGVLALRPNHDAIRMHQIGNRTAFTQKLRIANNIELCAVAIVSLDRFSHFFARLYRHRALVDNYPIIARSISDGTSRATQSQREGRNELNELNIVCATLFIVPRRWDRNSNRTQISGMP